MAREVALSPAAQLARRNTSIGVFLIALALLATAALPMVVAWPLALFGTLSGGLLVWGGFVTRTSARGSEAVNRAWDATSRGQLAEAQRALDSLSTSYQLGYIERVADFCAARIAFRMGDLPTALARSTAVLERPNGLFGRAYVAAHQVNARALRAVVLAAMGRGDEARADAAVVRKSGDAHPDALARAELAEAIVLEKAGDRGALGAHLKRHAALFSEGTTPRERAIVRAYERLVRGRTASVYRTGATREDAATEASEPTVEDWLTRVAPSAAPFARRSRVRPEGDVVKPASIAPTDARLEGAAAKEFADRMSRDDKSTRMWLRYLAVWVALVVFVVGSWSFIDAVGRPVGRAAHHAAIGTGFIVYLPAILIMVFSFSLVGYALRKRALVKRDGRALASALRHAASGDNDRADRELEPLTRAEAPLHVAHAHLALASSAERRGDFAGCVAACDRGLAAVATNAQTRVLASSTVTPSLLAERALGLALTGKEAEGRAALAHVATTFPTFPLLARAERRFEVIVRAHAGDIEGAARIAADDTCDAALPSRDDLLGDVARAVASPDSMTREESTILRERLAEAPASRAWIEAVAPGLLATFETGRRVVDPYGTTDDAETEAQAEEEAHLALAATVLRTS